MYQLQMNPVGAPRTAVFLIGSFKISIYFKVWEMRCQEIIKYSPKGLSYNTNNDASVKPKHTQ